MISFRFGGDTAGTRKLGTGISLHLFTDEHIQYYAEQMNSFRRIRLVVGCLAIAFLSVSAIAQASIDSQQIRSCRRFAEEFYGWYVPLTQKRMNLPASDVAIRDKATVFSPELLKALRIDSKAQAQSSGEIVGIDWDPFVGGQDPADHYAVRQVVIIDKRCFAEVWRDSPTDTTKASQKPDAVAELAQHAGRWEFANFRYPEVGGDLMSALAALRIERSRPQPTNSDK